MGKPLFSISNMRASPLNGEHAVNTLLLPGTTDETDIYTDRSACGMDLTDLKFMELPKNYSGAPIVQQDILTTNMNESVSFSVEILVFPTPRWCAGQEKTCDLSPIGIGRSIPDEGGEMLWELCADEKLQISDVFKGYHTSVSIQTLGSVASHVNHGLIAPFEWGGRAYKTIFANCGTHSRPVQISGKLQFECTRDIASASLAGNDEYAPIPYAVVSILVFVFCMLCMIRIQCHQRPDGYEATSRSEPQS